ncbi:glutathione binding-like protein [Emcibacter sp. SYSU 3D8]|uniref:glutathione S-transferase family protein n=1 Tax=Emcibacter sp. SYSU 3D8 TaxID=3133969 RepID=UPI0031FE6AAC
MEHIDARDARDLPGLRLAVTKNIPNPFCEAAKSLFHVKGIAFTPVAQHAAQPNEDLKAWSGHRNAPVAVWNDEPARAGWAEILMLAERLKPEPPLLPADRAQRAQVFGICHEICGEGGYAWNSRFMMFPQEAANDTSAEKGAWDEILHKQYGASRAQVEQAPERAATVLRFLAAQLHRQREEGSDYFVGDSLTAADIFWACMSIGVSQLPTEWSATPGFLRKVWGQMGERLQADLDPILIEHRDRIYRTYLKLPLEF